MAYNRKNFLLRVKEINEIYKRETRKGLSNEYIFIHYQLSTCMVEQSKTVLVIRVAQ